MTLQHFVVSMHGWEIAMKGNWSNFSSLTDTCPFWKMPQDKDNVTVVPDEFWAGLAHYNGAKVSIFNEGPEIEWGREIRSIYLCAGWTKICTAINFAHLNFKRDAWKKPVKKVMEGVNKSLLWSSEKDSFIAIAKKTKKSFGKPQVPNPKVCEKVGICRKIINELMTRHFLDVYHGPHLSSTYHLFVANIYPASLKTFLKVSGNFWVAVGHGSLIYLLKKKRTCEGASSRYATRLGLSTLFSNWVKVEEASLWQKRLKETETTIALILKKNQRKKINYSRFGCSAPLQRGSVGWSSFVRTLWPCRSNFNEMSRNWMGL